MSIFLILVAIVFAIGHWRYQSRFKKWQRMTPYQRGVYYRGYADTEKEYM